MATISQNTISKITDSHETGLKTKKELCRVIKKVFRKRSKLDQSINLSQAISLSRDLSEANDDMLIMEVSDEEIFEAVKLINPLKAPGLDDMQVIFNCKS